MKNNEEKLQELINDMGSFIEYWGFRNIHGRVWGLIYLSDKALSTPEIVEGLGVSKALISGALNELLEHKLIEREGQVKYGGITYISTPNPAKVVRDIIKQRELALFSKIEQNLSQLNRLSAQDSKDIGVNKESIKRLKLLTGCHKKIAQKISSKNINTMDDWICFMKKIARFPF